LTWGDIAICGVCGGWLRVAKRGNAKYGAKKETYCCDPKGCVGRNVEALDGYVRRLVIARLGSPDAAATLEVDRGDAVAVLERLAGLRARQAVAADDYAAGLITRDQLVRITESLAKQISDVQAELRWVQPAMDISVLDGLIGPHVAEKWDALPVVKQRRVLEVLRLRLEVHPVERRGPGFDENSIKFPQQGSPFGL
jgi:site-specific DNA recombinase